MPRPRARGFFAKACVTAIAVAAMACGISAESALSDRGAPSPAGADPEQFADGAAGTAALSGDGGRSSGLVSPLCQSWLDAGAASCDPDSELACPSALADAGSSDASNGDAPAPLVDGGSTIDAAPPSGDAASRTANGCRVVAGSNDQPVNTCRPAGSGRDGAQCDKSQDCAPGFECSAAGLCRRYCCDGKCEGSSLNGPGTFCDIQQTRDVTKLKVPLCIPLHPCELFSVGQCKDGEYCSVVSPGKSGCIARGGAVVGESCESTHCERDLACLGQLGSRTCKKLCRENQYDCPQGKICKPSSTIPKGYGICEAP
jgi:hypothetical protein